MLPKARRLTTHDFKEIFGRGSMHRGRYFVLKAVPSKPGSAALFGVSVSKKAFKKAVDRNKARRRGYAAIAPLLPRIKPSAKYLFSMGKALKMPSFEEIASDIEALLRSSRFLA